MTNTDPLLAAIRAAQPRTIRLTRFPADDGRVVLVVETDDNTSYGICAHCRQPIADARDYAGLGLGRGPHGHCYAEVE